MSSAFAIGARHATWILAYLAGVLVVLVALAFAVTAAVVVGRVGWRIVQPRLDIIRNR